MSTPGYGWGFLLAGHSQHMVARFETVTAGINLDDYADRLANLGPALNVIGAYAERQVKIAITKGEKLSGEKLAPLAPSTKAEKRLRGKARGILRRDGGLLASITFVRTKANEVMVGTNLEYAPWVILGVRERTYTAPAGKPFRFYTADGWRSAYEVTRGIPERNVFEGAEQALGGFVSATMAAYLEGDL